MKKNDTCRILDAMIGYFEGGNRETDYVAKSILESDFEYAEKWKEEIKRIKDSAEWTGLRAVEADIIVSALHVAKTELESSS